MVIRHMDVVVGTPSLGTLMAAISGVKTIVISEHEDHWLWQHDGFGQSPWFENLFLMPVRAEGKLWHAKGLDGQEVSGTMDLLIKAALEKVTVRAEARDAA